MIVNELKYPWLATTAISGWSFGDHPHPHYQNTTQDIVPSRLEGWSLEGEETIASARTELRQHGAVSFPEFLTHNAVSRAVEEMRSREDNAFTTNTEHTAYLKHVDTETYPPQSIYNHPTKTIVASTAYDELPEDSVLKELYTDPRLLKMVSSIVESRLHLSEDPLGCCSVNVFRPGYYHGFHYDESEFSVTLMLQDADEPHSGLFQYTDPIRSKTKPHNNNNNNNNKKDNDDGGLTLELKRTADVFRDHEHDLGASAESSSNLLQKTFAEHDQEASLIDDVSNPKTPPPSPLLHTLDFRPGTLLVLAGSKSLHRVTAVKGNRSRFVAVLTFASRPGFCNTPEVQKMFWGRTGAKSETSSSDNNANKPRQDCKVHR